MSVNSVSTGLPPSYGPLSGNNSQTAKSAALAPDRTQKKFATAGASRLTGDVIETTARDASVASDDATDAGQFQSTLEQELREGGASSGRSTGGASGSPGGRSPPGIALYQRISQYGNNEPATSALLKSWNTIMQSGPEPDSAVAAFAKTLSQNETLGFERGVLDLTA